MYLEYNYSGFKKTSCVTLEQFKTIINDLEQRKIPNKYPNELLYSSHEHFMLFRNSIIQKQGFALLSNNWIDKLVEWIGCRKCLEVMCGTGALSYILKKRGINIIPTDDFSWHQKFDYWLNIENIDCVEAINKYGRGVELIIISWACLDNNAYKCLMQMREVNPNCKMIFIGEEMCGCTADDSFFENAIEVEDKKLEIINRYFQSWQMIYDHIKLYK